MDHFILSQVAKLSPVQCPVNLPAPAKVDLESRKLLLLPKIVLRALKKQKLYFGISVKIVSAESVFKVFLRRTSGKQMADFIFF